MNLLKDCLTMIVKMALQDGILDKRELEYIEGMSEAIPDFDLDSTIQEARHRSIQDLVSKVDNYADRFFLAFRVYLMAFADQHYDKTEEAFYNKLVKTLEITPEDQQLIKRTETGLRVLSHTQSEERMRELWNASTYSKL